MQASTQQPSCRLTAGTCVLLSAAAGSTHLGQDLTSAEQPHTKTLPLLAATAMATCCPLGVSSSYLDQVSGVVSGGWGGSQCVA